MSDRCMLNSCRRPYGASRPGRPRLAAPGHRMRGALLKGSRDADGHPQILCSFYPGELVQPAPPGLDVASALRLVPRRCPRPRPRTRTRRRGSGRTMITGQGSAAQPVPATKPRSFPLRGPLSASALALLQQEAEQFLRAAKAPSTLRAYRSDWEHFRRWCQQHSLVATSGQPRNRSLVSHRAGCHPPAGDHDTAIDRHHQSPSDCRRALARYHAATRRQRNLEGNSADAGHRATHQSCACSPPTFAACSTLCRIHSPAAATARSCSSASPAASAARNSPPSMSKMC